jgi:adenylate kinase
MAPITDRDVAQLKSEVARLERRVAELEGKTGGSSSAPKTVAEKMRMVLMGPPGAGKATTIGNSLQWCGACERNGTTLC